MTESHFDDESLSAALDGEDAPAAAHVAGCAACRARSEALDAARRAVGADPAPAPAGLADRAVAAALATYAGERVTRATGDAAASKTANDAGDGAVVIPLRRPAAGPPDSFKSTGSPGRRLRRMPSWALGVAAALAAVLVAVPLLNAGNESKDAVVASSAAGSDKTTETASGPAVDGGDLGDQSDQLALGSVLTGAVGTAGNRAASPAAPATDGTADESAADAAARAAEPGTLSSEPQAVAGEAPAPTLASPAPGTSFTASTGADPAAIAACEAAAAKDFGDRVGPLVYRATLRWQGTPAVLLAYRLADTSSKGPDHQAFVMALDDCRVLVAQGF